MSRRGCLSLHSLDLLNELWRHPVRGWVNQGSLSDDLLWYGPVGGELFQMDVHTGEVLRVLRHDGSWLAWVGEDGAVVYTPGNGYERLDFESRSQWGWPVSGEPMASTDRYVLVATQLRRRLDCLSVESGKPVWSWEGSIEGAHRNATMGAMIRSGFPGVAVVKDRVLVTLNDGRVFSLSLADGQVLASARVAYSGAFLVTESSMFFKSAFGLMEFDHQEMRELGRVECRSEVEPLYRGERPTVNGFWLSEESVIWTTMHGALMGVNRKAGPDGRHQTWSEEIPDALMPLAEGPIGYGDYLYFTRKGEAPELICFKSVAS